LLPECSNDKSWGLQRAVDTSHLQPRVVQASGPLQDSSPDEIQYSIEEIEYSNEDCQNLTVEGVEISEDESDSNINSFKLTAQPQQPLTERFGEHVDLGRSTTSTSRLPSNCMLVRLHKGIRNLFISL